MDKIKVLFVINKPENDFKQAVLEVDPDYHKEFTDLKRIRIGDTQCRIDEYRKMKREICFNCRKPGHRASVNGKLVCTNDPACPICAGGHNQSECTHKGIPKCISCIRSKRDNHLHTAFSGICPDNGGRNVLNSQTRNRSAYE